MGLFRSNYIEVTILRISQRKRMIGDIPILEIAPEETRNESLPLIVYYHGWQSSKELTLTQGKYLAKLNCRVILPDAMNHGERKHPISKIPSKTFWESIHSNVLEFGYIVYYFKERHLIKDDKIGIGGVSMGGITTCALLTHHPEINVAACVMGSPQLEKYRERIAGHASQLDLYFPNDYKELWSWIPKYDLSQQPDLINGRPFLIWHGIHDNVIPYDHAKEFVDENPDQKSIQFIEDDIDHLVEPETMKKITAFFEKQFINA